MIRASPKSGTVRVSNHSKKLSSQQISKTDMDCRFRMLRTVMANASCSRKFAENPTWHNAATRSAYNARIGPKSSESQEYPVATVKEVRFGNKNLEVMESIHSAVANLRESDVRRGRFSASATEGEAHVESRLGNHKSNDVKRVRFSNPMSTLSVLKGSIDPPAE